MTGKEWLRRWDKFIYELENEASILRQCKAALERQKKELREEVS